MSEFCELVEYDKGKWSCPHCSQVSLNRGNYKRVCPAGGTPAKPKPPSHGPGYHLTRILARLGLTKTSTCGCKSHAAQMDRHGPDWCIANLDTIVGWMRAEAKTRGLPFSATAAGLLVRLAVRRARRHHIADAGK